MEASGDDGEQNVVRPSKDLEDFDFLNSYFMVFRKSILADPLFINFWKNIGKLEDKSHIIRQFEMGLSCLLVSLGYKFSCFVVRGPSVIYSRFEVVVPQSFNLPWLRTLICKENKECVPQLSGQLDRIEYPRQYIDGYVERMIGTAKPRHYFMQTGIKRALADWSLAVGQPIARRTRSSVRALRRWREELGPASMSPHRSHTDI